MLVSLAVSALALAVELSDEPAVALAPVALPDLSQPVKMTARAAKSNAEL
jgi:hypothetical protein